VLDKKESAAEFAHEDWRELVRRKQREIAAQLKQEEKRGFEGRSRLTLR
jgi:hypothetical protein